ncbi:hypothetical protein E2562_027780 [Oryza meyeriana var. granulata]|uniref:Uncharacterized protein n=1 Tax=Oryza meyeriana var. granulata TaxID=110450 RepID=A0A6G1EBZ3_9ORYZ|nr:hypothetical protein E2562_027780 [Oryza meyeriana var. granulata]
MRGLNLDSLDFPYRFEGPMEKWRKMEDFASNLLRSRKKAVAADAQMVYAFWILMEDATCPQADSVGCFGEQLRSGCPILEDLELHECIVGFGILHSDMPKKLCGAGYHHGATPCFSLACPMSLELKYIQAKTLLDKEFDQFVPKEA